jgi:hypothetical protein
MENNPGISLHGNQICRGIASFQDLNPIRESAWWYMSVDSTARTGLLPNKPLSPIDKDPGGISGGSSYPEWLSVTGGIASIRSLQPVKDKTATGDSPSRKTSLGGELHFRGLASFPVRFLFRKALLSGALRGEKTGYGGFQPGKGLLRLKADLPSNQKSLQGDVS